MPSQVVTTAFQPHLKPMARGGPEPKSCTPSDGKPSGPRWRVEDRGGLLTPGGGPERLRLSCLAGVMGRGRRVGIRWPRSALPFAGTRRRIDAKSPARKKSELQLAGIQPLVIHRAPALHTPDETVRGGHLRTRCPPRLGVPGPPPIGEGRVTDGGPGGLGRLPPRDAGGAWWCAGTAADRYWSETGGGPGSRGSAVPWERAAGGRTGRPGGGRSGEDGRRGGSGRPGWPPAGAGGRRARVSGCRCRWTAPRHGPPPGAPPGSGTASRRRSRDRPRGRSAPTRGRRRARRRHRA